METVITVKQTLSVASHNLQNLFAYQADSSISSTTRKNLDSMIDTMSLHIVMLKGTAPDRNIDLHIKQHKRKFSLLYREFGNLPPGMIRRTIERERTYLWQATHWKLLAYAHAHQEEVVAYPHPTKVTYTKESVLGLTDNEIASIVLPKFEAATQGDSVPERLNKAHEALTPILVRGFKERVRFLPRDLREMERSLRYIKEWYAPIKKQVKEKTLRFVNEHGGNYSSEAMLKTLDSVESTVFELTGQENMMLAMLLAFKQYVQLH